jgi:hypothetical protein
MGKRKNDLFSLCAKNQFLSLLEGLEDILETIDI